MPIYNTPIKQVDPHETRRYAGLSKADFSEELITAACLDAQLLASPRGTWQVYDYNACTATVLSSPPFVIEGEKIRRHLENSSKVVLLAVTIGEAIEEEIHDQFKAGKYSYSLLLDAAATTAVEQAADDMEKTIRQQAERLGCEMVWRFSPGYGDWDIRFQPEMIRLSQADDIDIRLSSSMMLIPRKSITAIIGLVPKKNNSASAGTVHTCENCNKTDCLARRK